MPAAYVAPPPVPVAPPPRDDRQLRTLKRLRERGSISEADYARRRAEFGADTGPA